MVHTSGQEPTFSSSSLTESRFPVRILDGGLGTSLEDLYNIHFSSEITPLWSSHLLTTPELRATLQDLHGRFVEAGADLVETGTYQASFEGFERTGIGRQEEEARSCMRAAVDLVYAAQSTRGKREGTLVLSLGPYGACMIPSTEYTGLYPSEMRSTEALERWHLERLRVFADDARTWGMVDMVAFETMGRVDEIMAIRRCVGRLRSANRGDVKPFWISCVFPGEKGRLPDGSTVLDVVEGMVSGPSHLSLPSGIGINCTKLHHLRSLICQLESALLSPRRSTTTSNDVPAAQQEGQSLRSSGMFDLILYPDGADDSVYDAESQTWISSTPSPVGLTFNSATNGNGDGQGGKKTWAEGLAEIVREVILREEEREGKGETKMWRGIVVGGCCKVGPGMVGEMKRELSR